MSRAAFADSISALEPPPEEVVNTTLDPLGCMVHFRLEALFAPDQIAEFRTVFIARHMIANEIERLMAILDRLDGDPDIELNLAGYVGNDDPRLDDAEGDHTDDERALGGGAADAEDSQEAWADGESDCCADCEFDPAENGLADFDGMAEQMA